MKLHLLLVRLWPHEQPKSQAWRHYNTLETARELIMLAAHCLDQLTLDQVAALRLVNVALPIHPWWADELDVELFALQVAEDCPCYRLPFGEPIATDSVTTPDPDRSALLVRRVGPRGRELWSDD